MPRARTAQHVMAYVTVPNQAAAEKIARTVLRRRLAACANFTPIESLYWWEGSLEHAREVLLIFKTRRALVPRLTAAVRAAHPYEVPCIVTYPMESGFPPYLAWIDRETKLHR